MSALRDFIHLVKNNLIQLPSPQNADSAQDVEQQAESAEEQADAAELQAREAAEKARIMERLAALLGPYKAAVANNDHAAQRLHSLVGTIKNSIGKQQFTEAADGLDMLEDVLNEQSTRPSGGGDGDDESSRKHGMGLDDIDAPSRMHGMGLEDDVDEPSRKYSMGLEDDDERPSVTHSLGLADDDNAPSPMHGMGLEDAESGEKVSASGSKGGVVGEVPPTDSRQATVIVQNDTDVALILLDTKVENGEYDSPPEQKILPGKGPMTCVASSGMLDDGQFWNALKGWQTWRAEGDQGKTWFLSWAVGRDLESKCAARSDSYNDRYFAPKPSFGKGPKATFRFSLQNSGAKPPPPPPGHDAAVNLSCRIKVTNKTQYTLTLMNQDGDSNHPRIGDYISGPDKLMLQPDDSTSCVFGQTTNNKDDSEKNSIQGSMLWAVGSPAVTTWRIVWVNPVGVRNTARHEFEPDTKEFYSPDQIDEGDENVPVNFTLLGGGQAPKPSVLQSILISPDSPSLASNAQQQFTARGQYSDGSSRDVTSTVGWSSSAADVVAIDNKGLATAGPRSGTATVTATDSDTGLSATTAVTVTAPPPRHRTGPGPGPAPGEKDYPSDPPEPMPTRDWENNPAPGVGGSGDGDFSGDSASGSDEGN